MRHKEYPRLSEDQHAFYNENGYLIIENALEPFGTDSVREAYERVEAGLKPAWEQAIKNSTNSDHSGSNSHDMTPDYKKEPIFLDLANNPKVMPLISQIVGPRYQVANIICHNHPAHTEAHTTWHRDWQEWSHPRFTLRAKVFYYLDDQDKDMGCFSLVPGTHKNPNRPDPKKYSDTALDKMPGIINIAPPAGSAILWDSLCWHTALPNTSTKDRRTVMYIYSQFFIKNWESASPLPEIVDWAHTPQKRQLMGIHSIGGRLAWDRKEILYLPEQEETAKTKTL